MRIKMSFGLLVTLFALCVSSVAFAGPKYPTSLSINWARSSGQFSGNVKSHPGCIGGRKVAVYLKGPGSDRSVGNATSSPSGSWSVSPGKTAKGDYYAKTGGLSLNSGGKCAPAKSVSTHVS